MDNLGHFSIDKRQTERRRDERRLRRHGDMLNYVEDMDAAADDEVDDMPR